MQGTLFGNLAPAVDDGFGSVRRLELEAGAWVEHASEWLTGHQAVFDLLLREVDFRGERRLMYDRIVDVPRLMGSAPESGLAADFLQATGALLTRRYGIAFERITLAHYRDGRDSVAMHGDKMGSLVGETVVATVSLGHPRRFLLKPVRGGPSRSFSLGWGDLFVMGGTCQSTYLHGVPKTAHAGARISIMFRPRIPEADAAAEVAARQLVRATAERRAPFRAA